MSFKVYRVDQVFTRRKRAKIWDQSTCVYATFPGHITRCSSPYDTVATFQPNSWMHMTSCEQMATEVGAPIFGGERYQWVESTNSSHSVISKVERPQGITWRTSGYITVFDHQQDKYDFYVATSFYKLEYDYPSHVRSLFLVKLNEPPPDPHPAAHPDPGTVTPIEPRLATPPEPHPGGPHEYGTYLFI